MPDQIIAEFEYGNERIRAMETEFKGKKYFSVRGWYEAESGEWRPGKNGINLRTEAFWDFLNMVIRLAVKLDKNRTREIFVREVETE